MKQNGDDPQELEDWLNPPEPVAAASVQPAEPPEKLKKYLRMKKMNIPLVAIKNKMKQNGDDPQELEDWLNPPAPQPAVPAKPPEHLSKYLRMIKMKIPLQVVKNK